MAVAQNVKREVASNINPIKSRLIDELRTLEQTPGCAVAARELGTIIGRLEHWQHKQR
ncbi:MAG: hypothetical protein JO253_03335 [Alphaproteobacteria bacterium]|nr:hypothetical protein [Alphaproteobacteria bacterium]